MKFQSLAFIFFCCVYFVLGESSFIPKGQRAEIFELTDNEVPVFRITLSEDEYNLLKRKASRMDSSFFKNINKFIKEIIEIINKQNLTEVFPGYNIKEILPKLPMNENGHPNIDYEKFYINIDNLHYIDFVNIKKSFYNIFNKNEYLDLINVFQSLNNLDISSEANKTFVNLIKEFGTDDEKLFADPEDTIDNIPINDDYFGYYYNYAINNRIFDDSPSSSSNDDTPSSIWSDYNNWIFDSSSSSWDDDNTWNHDTSSFSWDDGNNIWDDDDSPNSRFNNDSPSSRLNNDSPNSSLDDDYSNSSPFSFKDFFNNFILGQSDNDNEVDSINNEVDPLNN